MERGARRPDLGTGCRRWVAQRGSDGSGQASCLSHWIDLLWCCRSRQWFLAIRAGLGRRLGGWRLRDTSAARKRGVQRTEKGGGIVYIV